MRRIIFFLLCFSTLCEAQNLEEAAKNPPFGLSGNIALGGFFYNSERISNRQNPYGYSINAAVNFQVYGLSIPVRVVLNEQGSAFQNPFNRFGISPTYKSWTAHLGHQNLNYSPFSVGGVNFFGVGLEFEKAGWRMSFLKGRFREANNGNDSNYVIPQFKRKGYMARLGFGSKKHYFDMILLQAHDDINSISVPDSIANRIDAHDNTVFGIDARFPFFKNKVFLKIDGGISAFTQDLRGLEISAEKYPQINKINWLFTPNISSSVNYAGEASLNFKIKNFRLAGKYRRVMPDYKSLGVNYLLTDVEAVTINPTISFFKSKMLFSSSLGLQRNNLLEHRTAGTTRTIGSANLNVNPSPMYGINLQYSNYSLNQQVLRDTILNDSILIDQISHNFSVMPRLTIMKNDKIHNVFLLANYQILDDKNPGTEQFSDNDFVLLNLNYALSFIPQKLNLRMGLNYFNFQSNLVKNTRYGFTAGIGKRFLDSRLTMNLNGTYNWVNQAEWEGTNVNLSLLTRYKVSKKGSISLQFFWLNNNVSAKDFSETRGQLRYNHRF